MRAFYNPLTSGTSCPTAPQKRVFWKNFKILGIFRKIGKNRRFWKKAYISLLTRKMAKNAKWTPFIRRCYFDFLHLCATQTPKNRLFSNFRQKSRIFDPRFDAYFEGFFWKNFDGDSRFFEKFGIFFWNFSDVLNDNFEDKNHMHMIFMMKIYDD